MEVFLDYVAGKTSNDEYIQKLEGAVKKVKANKEWRRDYMSMEIKLREREEEGEKKAANLINYLWENGRGDDAKKAANNKDFFDKLLSELASELNLTQ